MVNGAANTHGVVREREKKKKKHISIAVSSKW